MHRAHAHSTFHMKHAAHAPCTCTCAYTRTCACTEHARRHARRHASSTHGRMRSSDPPRPGGHGRPASVPSVARLARPLIPHGRSRLALPCMQAAAGLQLGLHQCDGAGHPDALPAAEPRRRSACGERWLWRRQWWRRSSRRILCSRGLGQIAMFGVAGNANGAAVSAQAQVEPDEPHEACHIARRSLDVAPRRHSSWCAHHSLMCTPLTHVPRAHGQMPA